MTRFARFEPPPPANWEIHGMGVVYHLYVKNPPCKFHRFMQHVVLGIQWRAL